MTNNLSTITVLLAEDDDGHATLIERNLKRAGLKNGVIRFRDGQEVLDFLFQNGKGPIRENGRAYLLLLDIRMPKVDGLGVLRRIKENRILKKMPVIMLTTTDDPVTIDKCHDLGCSNYIVKPVDYDKFMKAVRNIGLFIMVVKVPEID